MTSTMGFIVLLKNVPSPTLTLLNATVGRSPKPAEGTSGLDEGTSGFELKPQCMVKSDLIDGNEVEPVETTAAAARSFKLTSASPVSLGLVRPGPLPTSMMNVPSN